MHSVGTMDTNLPSDLTPAHSSSYKLGSTEYLSTKKISFEIQMLYYRYVHFVGPHTPPPRVKFGLLLLKRY